MKCGEAYPLTDGAICRGCQGDAPFLPLANLSAETESDQPDFTHVLPVEDAVGMHALNDMTRIESDRLEMFNLVPGVMCATRQAFSLLSRGRRFAGTRALPLYFPRRDFEKAIKVHCALYFKTTSLDLLLPRLLAGINVTRLNLAKMAEGGFCLSCKKCTYPKCHFGK